MAAILYRVVTTKPNSTGQYTLWSEPGKLLAAVRRVVAVEETG
ncbi:MAG: hypothetical protein ACYDAG_19065 [Chloroflexota bacterium]